MRPVKLNANLRYLIRFPVAPVVRDSLSREASHVYCCLEVAAGRSPLVHRDSWACLGYWETHSLMNLPHLLRTVRVRFVPAWTVLEAHHGKGGRYCVLYIAYMVAPIYGSGQKKLMPIHHSRQ